MAAHFDLVVYTRDRHPPDHCSFAPNGGQWPVHCVDETLGFAFSPKLPVVEGAIIIDKATHRGQDAYSGFDGTDLATCLRQHGIERCVIAGLATDYCIEATALDALANDFETWVVTDAIAAVDIQPGDGELALNRIRSAGAKLRTTDNALHELPPPPNKTALIVVDVQNDFCEGGALAVPNSDRIFAPLRRLLGETPGRSSW